MSTIVTCIAPVNIAVIKYWGKRDEVLILPINDSISATLDTEQLCAKTTIMANPNFKEDKMWLNGREESMDNSRIQNLLKELKTRAKTSKEMESWKLHICSENNFPTAAGLASSAAGYACLATALSKLYKVDVGDISAIARSGSGSACRSVYGGFVRWYMGRESDGKDSIAKPIVSSLHWPEMRILVLVVSDIKKKVSSAVGMKRSVITSELLKHRANEVLPKRVEEMQKAIEGKNFELFAEYTMKDSNQMHATCLDTYPPCVYMNDTSHLIVDFVHSYNIISNQTRVAYTFDAGPNATLFLLEQEVSKLLQALNHFFPPDIQDDSEYLKGIPVRPTTLSDTFIKNINFPQQSSGKLKYIIHTRIGDGPKQLFDSKHHLLYETGFPL